MRILATLAGGRCRSTATLGTIDVLKQKEEVRKVLGYLPQEFGVYPKVNAYEMLGTFIIALLKGVTLKGERKELVEALLQRVNLWENRKRRLGKGFSAADGAALRIALSLIAEADRASSSWTVDRARASTPASGNRFYNLLMRSARTWW